MHEAKNYHWYFRFLVGLFFQGYAGSIIFGITGVKCSQARFPSSTMQTASTSGFCLTSRLFAGRLAPRRSPKEKLFCTAVAGARHYTCGRPSGHPTNSVKSRGRIVVESHFFGFGGRLITIIRRRSYTQSTNSESTDCRFKFEARPLRFIYTAESQNALAAELYVHLPSRCWTNRS